MNSPTCGHSDSWIVRTKNNGKGVVHRVRQCERCGCRWKTGEVPIADLERATRIVEAAKQLQVLAGLQDES